MKEQEVSRRVLSCLLVLRLIFFSISSPIYLHAADPLLEPVSISSTDPFASSDVSLTSTIDAPTSTESLLSSPLSSPTIEPELVVLRDVGGSTGWYEVRDGGRWTPYGNQFRSLEAEVISAGDYTLRIWAKNYFNPGWKKPAGFTHFELSVKVDGVEVGILSIQADDFRFRSGELMLTNLGVGTHTIEVRWVNASGYDAAAKEDANLFLNAMVLEEIASPVTSGAGHVLESRRWNHVTADNSQWTNYSGESVTYEIVSEGGDISIDLEAMNHNASGWSKGASYTYYEFEVRLDGIYKGLLRVTADDTTWQMGSFVIRGLAAGKHVIRLLWLNGGQYNLAARTDPNVWIRPVSINPASELWGNFLLHGGFSELGNPASTTLSHRVTSDMLLFRNMGIDAIDPVPCTNLDVSSCGKILLDSFWNQWFGLGGQITPWVMPGATNYPRSLLDPERFAALESIYSNTIDALGEHIASVNGRYLFDIDKEGPSSWRSVTYPEDVARFVDYLLAEFQDSSPASDTNGDGITFNDVSHESYVSWDDLKAIDPNLLNPFQHPYLMHRYVLWANEMIFRGYYQRLGDETNASRLMNYLSPPRFMDRQDFIRVSTSGGTKFTGPIGAEDYWTRNDPTKRAILQFGYPGFSYENQNAVDANLADFFGRISRNGGLYFLQYDRSGDLNNYWYDLYNMWSQYPQALRDIHWWSEFYESQNWLLEDTLTPQTDIAILDNGEDIRELSSTVSTTEVAAMPTGYNAHTLSFEQILGGALNDYKVFIFSAPRLPEEVLEKILAFKENGGTVIGLYTAGMYNTRGEPMFGEGTPQYFERIFGATPDRFYRDSSVVPQVNTKNPFDDLDPLWNVFTEFGAGEGQRILMSGEGSSVDSTGLITVRPIGATQAIGFQASSSRDGTFSPASTGAIVATMTSPAGRSGAGIYLGSTDNYNGQFNIPWHVLFDLVNIRRNLQITGPNGAEITGYLKSNETLDAHFVTFTNSTDAGSITITLPELGDGYQIWDVKNASLLGTLINHEFTVEVEANETALFFIARDQGTIDRFIANQGLINRSADDLLPIDMPIHFFAEVAGGPESIPDPNDFVTTFPRDATQIIPRAVIVLGEGASDRARYFANRLQAFFYTWRNGINRLSIPILEASQVTDAIRSQNNLVLIGGPETNSVSLQLITDGSYGLNPVELMSGRQRNSWAQAGNAVMVLDDEAAFQTFYNYIQSNLPSLVSPTAAPWEGYAPTPQELIQHWGNYSGPSLGGMATISENVITIDTLSHVIDSKGGIQPNVGLFYSNDIDWYGMDYSLDMNIADQNSIAGASIGEYFFLTDGSSWKILSYAPMADKNTPNSTDFRRAWLDNTGLLQSGSFANSIAGEWHSFSFVLDAGIFSIAMDGNLLAQTETDSLWIDRRPHLAFAGLGESVGGIVSIRNLLIKTKDYDIFPLLS